MSDRPTPETDAAVFLWEGRAVAPPSVARRLERERENISEKIVQLTGELADAKRERDAFANKFTKLDKPKYSGDPMLDAVLETTNEDFRAWVDSLPPTYWTRYDLSAARIGWEAALNFAKGIRQ